MVAIEIETPLQDDVRDMVVELNDVLNPLSPPEFQFQMSVEQMNDPSTIVFVARDADGDALGMGALKVHDDQLGEVKRMFSRPEIRGRGVGFKLYEQIEKLARRKGLRELKLETGNVEGFEAAWKLYERMGFEECDAFLDYPQSKWSRVC